MIAVWLMNHILYSWGTKGDNSISKDLGVVKKKKTKDGQADDDSFEEVLPADMLDANTQYQEALQDLEKKQVEKEVRRVYSYSRRYTYICLCLCSHLRSMARRIIIDHSAPILCLHGLHVMLY